MHGFVAALIAVGTEGNARAQGKLRIEDAQEREWDAVFRRPAVRHPGTDGTERFPFGLVAEPDALTPVRAEAQLHAGVGVDLEVYITSVVREREEKFHAAVLMDGTERGAAHRPDVRFPGTLENIERGIVVAELLLHADAAVRLPQHAARAQRLDRVPVGRGGCFCYRVAFHSACPPRYTALRFSAASHTTKSASFPTAMEPISAS